ncbi:fasciclin domain-containing protein [Pseudoflavitalea sp. G-6-1-2]|uniref:fasciclin domain-containing protein n=1 Tax=Pseudoflavitalea sp. G-6-1-2 TaxID=2728841 RepID=UPI00146A584E|nr:fasciclin domain-containing protein [Pseudoflavitalea sp. G-6-1-2]NML22617.1 fasciclin domain-containing protein [Pseudoflavitalea sp. G-6-1-2]
MKLLVKYITVCLLLMTAACIKKQAIPPPADNGVASLRDLLANNFSYSMFYSAMKRTSTDSLLDNAGEGYTIFLPDDGAFGRSGISRDSLGKMKVEDLKKLVLYHIVAGRVPTNSIPQIMNHPMPTVEKDFVYASSTSQIATLYINGIAVNKQDVMAKNGLIHVLNQALSIPAASVQDIIAATPEYSVFAAGLKKFGLWDQLKTGNPMVVLAPTNEAYAAYNWDVEAINNMDVREYRKMAFGTNILSPAFFFINDLRIAPPQGPFMQEDVMLISSGSGGGFQRQLKVVPFDWQSPENSLRSVWYGDWVFYPDDQQGQLAVNGVVIRSQTLNVIPDSAKVKTN